MNMIESIMTYLCTCPLLKDGALRVDYLGDVPTEYVVESVPTSGVVKQYADGGSLREYLFVFGSREYYGDDIIQNLENSGFYEKFAAWIKEQDDNGNYPDFEEGKTAQKIEVTTSGYLFDATENNARYQIQCRILYYQD